MILLDHWTPIVCDNRKPDSPKRRRIATMLFARRRPRKCAEQLGSRPAPRLSIRLSGPCSPANDIDPQREPSKGEPCGENYSQRCGVPNLKHGLDSPQLGKIA